MPERKLLDQISDLTRLRHMSLGTEQAYRNWAKRYILFHGKRHPREMGADEVQAFLTHLAVSGRADKDVRGPHAGCLRSTSNTEHSHHFFVHQTITGEHRWRKNVQGSAGVV